MEIKLHKMATARLVLFVASTVIAGLAQSADLYVYVQPPYSYDVDPDTNIPNNCRNSYNPCETIAHAVSQAQSGDVLDLSSQTYDVSNVTITQDITFNGEGKNNTFFRSPADVTARHFIIDIDDATMSATNFDAVVTFNNLTLRGGNAQNENGGSIRVVDGGVVVRNVMFRNNHAANGGAIICTFDGVDLCRSVDVKGSVFINNTADGSIDEGNGYGGAMYIKTYKRAVESPILNSTFKNNTANYAGGALYYLDQVVDITKSSFTSNTAGNPELANSSGFGGAIYFDYAYVHIKKSLFEQNYALTGGGALYASNRFISATNSTFSENSADGFGGAFYFDIRNPDNSYFSSLTFYGNSTALNSFGATLYSDVNVNMSKSIIYDSRGSEACEGSATITGFDNLIDDASCGAGFFEAVTQFVNTLEDNGGPTKTHRIGSGSNARDNSGSCFSDSGNTLTHDQRGELRDSNCDIGAYEVPAGTPFAEPIGLQSQLYP